MQALCDVCVEFATAGEVTSFEDLMGRWDTLGPDIDAATTAIRAPA